PGGTVAVHLNTLNAPSHARAALQKLSEDLTTSAPSNLVALIVYGGLARGRFHLERSDINLLVLLRDTSLASLRAIAEPLHAAWREVRVEPFVLRADELTATAAAFPTKFLDIKDHHVLLTGEDPFTQLEVSHEHIRLRIEQELRNLALRLRRRFLFVAQNPSEVLQLLTESARPLALELAALLRLTGKTVPIEDRTAAILEAAAAAFTLDREALAEMASLRDGQPPRLEAMELFGRVLSSIETAAATVARR